jgi:hypothetical protein
LPIYSARRPSWFTARSDADPQRTQRRRAAPARPAAGRPSPARPNRVRASRVRPNRVRASRVRPNRVRASRVRPSRRAHRDRARRRVRPVHPSRVRPSRRAHRDRARRRVRPVHPSRVRASRRAHRDGARRRVRPVHPSRLTAPAGPDPELPVASWRRWRHHSVRLPKSQARRRCQPCRRFSSGSWRFLSYSFSPTPPRAAGGSIKESDMALVKTLRCSSQRCLPPRDRGLC